MKVQNRKNCLLKKQVVQQNVHQETVLFLYVLERISISVIVSALADKRDYVMCIESLNLEKPNFILYLKSAENKYIFAVLSVNA